MSERKKGMRERAAVANSSSSSSGDNRKALTPAYPEEKRADRGASYLVAYQVAAGVNIENRKAPKRPTFHITTLEKDTDRNLCLQYHSPRCPCRDPSPRQCNRVSWRKGGGCEASCQKEQQAWTMRRDPLLEKMRLKMCAGDGARVELTSQPRIADDLRAKTISYDMVIALCRK